MRFLPFLAVVPAIAALGCNGSPSPAPSGTPVMVDVQRDLAPQVAPADEAALVAGNTGFAFDLYQRLDSQGPGSNLFYSPYSVSLALAMTYAGAAGSTATQMASALHFTLPASKLHPAFDKLDLAIEAKPAGATGANGQPFALNLADSLWGGQKVDFGEGFLKTLALDYGAGLRTVDFAEQPEQAETDINNWVSGKTDGKIDPLLGPGTITPDTRFVIVNAVYFDASWATAFEKSQTKPGTFTRANGTTVTTPMMSSANVATAYAKGQGWQAVELPYSGGTTSMVIVVPDAGAYASIEHGLSGSFYASVTSSLSPAEEISLTMPSFKIHGASVSLARPLAAMGMTDAFDPDKADFSPMIPAGGVYISDVVHQAFVDVDESGTEAAAATAVVGGFALAVGSQVAVNVDRPFFFFIRDTASNTVLFVGREVDPTAQ